MRTLQNEKLRPYVEKVGCQLHWHDSVNDIAPSNQYSLVIAHEFFDALPIHLLQVCRLCIILLQLTFWPTNCRKPKTAGMKY